MNKKFQVITIIVIILLFSIVVSLPSASCQTANSWVNIQVISFDGQNIFFTMNFNVRGNHVNDLMWVQTESSQSDSVSLVISRAISDKVFNEGTNLTVFSYSYAYNLSYYNCSPKIWNYVLFPYDKHTVSLTIASNFNFTLDGHPTNCVVPSQNYDGSFQVYSTKDPTVYNIILDVYHSQSFQSSYFWILVAVLGSLYGLSIFLFAILTRKRKKAEKISGDLVRVSSAIIFFVPAFEIALNSVKAPLPLVFSDILIIPIVPINAILIIIALILRARNQSQPAEIAVKVNAQWTDGTKQSVENIKPHEPKSEAKSEETKKLMDWALQSIISWSVGLLTVFFGLITLLVEVRLHVGTVGTGFFDILSLIYVLLALALAFSIIRIGSLYGELWQFQVSLPVEIRERFGTQPYLQLIINRKSNRVRVGVFVGLAMFFCVILILAWFL